MNQRWTAREVTILKNNYERSSRKELSVLFKSRTWNAIKSKAEKLKLSFQGTSEERFWKYVDKKYCWNWTGYCNNDGYGKIRIKDKMISTHRFSWELHNNKIPKDLCVLHKCDNPRCVKPSHLFLGTHQDNSDDKINKNRQIIFRGENHSNHKLTLKQVKEIRNLKNKFTQRKIAQMFNVHYTTIGLIHRNKLWNQEIKNGQNDIIYV